MIVHLGAPDCVETCAQQVGRAGRDGLRSYAKITIIIKIQTNNTGTYSSMCVCVFPSIVLSFIVKCRYYTVFHILEIFLLPIVYVSKYFSILAIGVA